VLTAAPTPLEPNPNQQPTEPDPHNTISYLEEFINSDTREDNTINQPTAPNGHRPQLSFNAILVLQTQVMEKLIVLIGSLIEKIDLLINATARPQKRTASQNSVVTLRTPILRLKPPPPSPIPDPGRRRRAEQALNRWWIFYLSFSSGSTSGTLPNTFMNESGMWMLKMLLQHMVMVWILQEWTPFFTLKTREEDIGIQNHKEPVHSRYCI